MWSACPACSVGLCISGLWILYLLVISLISSKNTFLVNFFNKENQFYFISEQRRLMANSMLADLSKFEPSAVAKAKRWPKVELHLHLDGSLSPEFIARRALVRGIMLPASPERLRAWLMDRKLDKLKKDDNKADKGGNWPVFDFCNQFLQTKLELREGTADLLRRLSEDGVVYAEIRFCPELHTREGLSEEEVVEAAIEGFRSQKQVVGGLILVALRSKDSAHSYTGC